MLWSSPSGYWKWKIVETISLKLRVSMVLFLANGTTRKSPTSHTFIMTAVPHAYTDEVGKTRVFW